MISINAGTDRYDHHQRGFEEVFGHGESVAPIPRAVAQLLLCWYQALQNRHSHFVPHHIVSVLVTFASCTGFVTKLSSAGLVYKHFGKQIVADALGKQQDSQDVQTTWLAVYKYFMEAIDGIDNGKPHSAMHRSLNHDQLACLLMVKLRTIQQSFFMTDTKSFSFTLNNTSIRSPRVACSK